MRLPAAREVGWLASALALVGGMVWVLYAMGQPWMSTSGKVMWWVGEVNSSEASQQLLDWYSFSHVLHGFLFLLGLRWLNRKLGLDWSWMVLFVLAVVLECGWEILENSPIIIDRYRQTAIANGYMGDSVLNSVSDVLCMVLGFVLASKLRVREVWILFVAVELMLAAVIRDNLTLNIIMLTYPVPVLDGWQAGVE